MVYCKWLIYWNSRRENSRGEPHVAVDSNFTLPKRQEKLGHLVTGDEASTLLMNRCQWEWHDWRAISLHIPHHHSTTLWRECDMSHEDYYRSNSLFDRKLLMNARYRTAIFSCTLLSSEASWECGTLDSWLPDSWGQALFLVPWTHTSEQPCCLWLPKYS